MVKVAVLRLLRCLYDVSVQPLFEKLHALIVVAPLRALYFQGPSVHGYGFWTGMDAHDICAHVSPGASALFWAQHADECLVMLDKQFTGFLTACQFAVLVVSVYRILSMWLFRWMVLEPALCRLERSRGGGGDSKQSLALKKFI